MDYETIIAEAIQKGQSAFAICKPQQFAWGQAKDITSNEIVGPVDIHGECGGAYITGIGGNDPFVRWAKKNNPKLISKGVYKGYDISIVSFCQEHTQEMEKKFAFAKAFAEVFNANGIKCYAKSYLT